MNRRTAQGRATPFLGTPFLGTPVRAGAGIEIATGLALVAAPSVVLDALIGSSAGDAPVVGRVLGGALLALGIGGGLTDPRAPERGIRLAFFVYNASTAAMLALAGVAGAADGVLLWPASALHALIAVGIASSHGGLRASPAVRDIPSASVGITVSPETG